MTLVQRDDWILGVMSPSDAEQLGLCPCGGAYQTALVPVVGGFVEMLANGQHEHIMRLVPSTLSDVACPFFQFKRRDPVVELLLRRQIDINRVDPFTLEILDAPA